MGNVNACVDLRRDGETAIVTIDNPPVNALRHEVRAGVLLALEQAAADDGVKAIVLTGAGRGFSAGADITEFGKPPLSPSLHDLIAAIETNSKPVIAALHGLLLGGGFELAMACHFRIAASGTRAALPEIKLGLIPGAGGTQRLPRLVGPERALQAIVSGEAIAGEELLPLGVIDAVAEGELTASAVAFARRVVSENRALRPVRAREEKLASTRADSTSFEAAVASLTRRSAGQHAPAAAVAAVRGSFSLPFEEGLRRERAAFMELVGGDQSLAQRHIFFAEREAAKVADMPAGTAPRKIERAAVLGAGTMGGGIAMCFANVGIPVTVVDTGADALRQGLDRVAGNYRTTMSRGRMTAAEMETRMALITGSADLAAVGGADIVIEAVFEDMALKQRVFADLGRLARPSAVLATNTSTLDVDVIAQSTARPQDVVGMHFFSPANVMRLLEIVRGKATSFAALATAVAVSRQLRKVPVVVGVCDGFVGNRMLARRTVEAERLLLEGASPQQVDAAVVGFGFPMGPLAMGDLAGLDVGWRIRKHRGTTAAIADALCEAGHFGQKTGSGYFRYERGDRTPRPDAEVDKLIVDTAWRLGVQRRDITAEEIVERMTFPMINEGARILAEGIAARPGDIDVIWVYGYGWPAWRGGPMFHADLIGLARIRDRLALYAERSGDATLKPAPLLERLAGEGKGFMSLATGKSGVP